NEGDSCDVHGPTSARVDAFGIHKARDFGVGVLGQELVYSGDDVRTRLPLTAVALRQWERQRFGGASAETHIGGDLVALDERDVVDHQSHHSFAFTIRC